MNYTKAVEWLGLEAAFQEASARAAEARRRYEDLQADASVADRVASESALATAEMRAPFNGTVTSLKLKVGEVAAASVPVITVADLSNWIVKTTDLSEIDVTAIQSGMPATVIFDSLPDLQLSGQVVAVHLTYTDREGDILYPVDVLLSTTDPRLRWGMTAEVTFGD
jgi:multidrug resistance efflux pump